MRRTLAAAILGISLWLGSLAWTGFILNRTILDPGRSQEVAEAVYDDETVRNQLAANIAAALAATIPDGVDVDRAVIDAAAANALGSPAVETLFVDALVATHAAFLGEGTAPESVDAGAMAAEARRNLVEARPELDNLLPASPTLVVPLPTQRMPNAGPLRDLIDTVVPLLAGLAAAGALLALGVTSNRPAVIRRAGFWAIGISATVLVFAYGIPALASALAPDQAEVVAAFIGAMAAATRVPAIALAAAGAGAIVLSLAWRAAPAVVGAVGAASDAMGGTGARPSPRTGDPIVTSAPARTPIAQRRDIPTPYRPAGESSAGTAPAGPPRRPDPDGYGARRPAPPPNPHPGFPDARPPVAPTVVGDAVPGSGTTPEKSAGSSGHDGVGRVVASADDIPDNARWVPGVGYVVDTD